MFKHCSSGVFTTLESYATIVCYSIYKAIDVSVSLKKSGHKLAVGFNCQLRGCKFLRYSFQFPEWFISIQRCFGRRCYFVYMYRQWAGLFEGLHLIPRFYSTSINICARAMKSDIYAIKTDAFCIFNFVF